MDTIKKPILGKYQQMYGYTQEAYTRGIKTNVWIHSRSLYQGNSNKSMDTLKKPILDEITINVWKWRDIMILRIQYSPLIL